MLTRIAGTPLINFVLAISCLLLLVGVSEWGSLVSLIALAALALVIAAMLTKIMMH